jgi:hypothetical protein
LLQAPHDGEAQARRSSMTSRAQLAGLGGIAFGVLTIIGLLIANPPGGNYKAHDAVKYVAHGHHAAVFVALYLLMLGLFGLLLFLAYLRDLAFAAGEGWGLARIFWSTSLVAIASLAVGWSVALGAAIAHAYGGKDVVVSPAVTYVIVETGSAAIWGAGGILLGFGLIALLIASRGSLPGWVRLATLVAALGGLASPAFFPSALLLLWAIAIGIWLFLTASRLNAAPVMRAG